MSLSETVYVNSGLVKLTYTSPLSWLFRTHNLRSIRTKAPEARQLLLAKAQIEYESGATRF